MSYTTLSKTDCPKLLIEVIEGKAQWIGGHTFMRYPSANWEADGYRTITWSQYADAINKVAVWLDEQLGKSHGNDTVAYLGPSDARYAILLPAVVKTNRKVSIWILISSQSNSMLNGITAPYT
jgi:acyl-CoA synthetase (AMP-forming)/AMP-acid ligase II